MKENIFPNKTKYLLLVFGLTTFNILGTIFFVTKDYDDYSIDPEFVKVSLISFLFVFPVISFLLGFLVALFPYKQLEYKEKYFRASILSSLTINASFAIVLALFILIRLSGFTPDPPIKKHNDNKYTPTIYDIIGFRNAYRDTIIRNDSKNFEILVPFGWKYKIPEQKESISFMAYREMKDENDLAVENYNLNIVPLKKQGMSIDETYKYIIDIIGDAEEFKILENGERTINGRRYRWLIERHKNSLHTNINMLHYIFITNNDDKTLILTMVSTTNHFEKYRTIFERIATSLNY